ncbi:MAG: SBBP repeat-containing protein [Myxococcota bacterium]
MVTPSGSAAQPARTRECPAVSDPGTRITQVDLGLRLRSVRFMWSPRLRTSLLVSLFGGTGLTALGVGCAASSVDDRERSAASATDEKPSISGGGSSVDDNPSSGGVNVTDGGTTDAPGNETADGGTPSGGDASDPSVSNPDDGTASGEEPGGGVGDEVNPSSPVPGTNANSSTWETSITLLGTTTADQYGNAVAFDDDGNLYLGGTAYGSFEGVAVYSSSDGFVSKYSPTLQHLWTRTISAIGAQAVEDLVVADDRVYVCGTTFGNLPGFDELSPYDGDVFVVAYDLDGHEEWALQVGTIAEEAAKALAFAPGEGVYVAGRTTGTLSDPAAFAEDHDALLLKVSLEGALLWQRQWGDDDLDFGHDVVVVPGQGVVTVGTTYVPGEDHFDATLARYSPTGALVWRETYGGNGDDFADRIARTSSGELLLIGERGSNLGTLAPVDGSDLSLARFSLTGAPLGESLLPLPGKAQAHSLLVTADGRVFLGGQTSGCLSAGCGNTELDALVLERDSAGAQGLAWQWGGPQVDWISALAYFEGAEEEVLVGVGSACSGPSSCDDAGDRQVLLALFRRSTK